MLQNNEPVFAFLIITPLVLTLFERTTTSWSLINKLLWSLLKTRAIVKIWNSTIYFVILDGCCRTGSLFWTHRFIGSQFPNFRQWFHESYYGCLNVTQYRYIQFCIYFKIQSTLCKTSVYNMSTCQNMWVYADRNEWYNRKSGWKCTHIPTIHTLTSISYVLVGSHNFSMHPLWLTPADTQHCLMSGSLGAAATCVDFILPGVRVRDLNEICNWLSWIDDYINTKYFDSLKKENRNNYAYIIEIMR